MHILDIYLHLAKGKLKWKQCCQQHSITALSSPAQHCKRTSPCCTANVFLGGFLTRRSLQEGFHQGVLFCCAACWAEPESSLDRRWRNETQSSELSGVGLPETRAPQAEQHLEIKNTDMYSPTWPGNSAVLAQPNYCHLRTSFCNFFCCCPCDPLPVAPPERCLAASELCVPPHLHTSNGRQFCRDSLQCLHCCSVTGSHNSLGFIGNTTTTHLQQSPGLDFDWQIKRSHNLNKFWFWSPITLVKCLLMCH